MSPKCYAVQCIVNGENSQNCPLLLGFRHPTGGGPRYSHRQHTQKFDKDRACGSGNILAETHTHTHTQTCSLQYCTTAPAGEVEIRTSRSCFYMLSVGGHGSVHFWRQCNMLWVSGFADDVFSYNGSNLAVLKTTLCFVEFARLRHHGQSCCPWLQACCIIVVYFTLSANSWPWLAATPRQVHDKSKSSVHCFSFEFWCTTCCRFIVEQTTTNRSNGAWALSTLPVKWTLDRCPPLSLAATAFIHRPINRTVCAFITPVEVFLPGPGRSLWQQQRPYWPVNKTAHAKLAVKFGLICHYRTGKLEW